MSESTRISELKALLHSNTFVVLAHEVDTALALIASGRIEHARKCLENALRYASAATEAGQTQVMLTNVRKGGGFK